MAELSEMTPGLQRALERHPQHSLCPDCNFALPRYPGRYPKHCPRCGKERALSPQEVARISDHDEE